MYFLQPVPLILESATPWTPFDRSNGVHGLLDVGPFEQADSL